MPDRYIDGLQKLNIGKSPKFVTSLEELQEVLSKFSKLGVVAEADDVDEYLNLDDAEACFVRDLIDPPV